MRQNGAGAGLGVAGLVCLLAAAGCASGGGASPDPARLSEDQRLAVARDAIARRIARAAEAVERKDMDALLDGAAPQWSDPDGRALTDAEAREALRREWGNVERTVAMAVRLDSLRLADDDHALVFTSQVWERIVIAGDGTRHGVRTDVSLAQAWARTAGQWRGTGPARVLREGPTLVDGKEVETRPGALASRRQ